MKKWIITILVIVFLVSLAMTTNLWLPPLLNFIGANSDLIQGLTDFVQLILWVVAGIVGLTGLWIKAHHKQEMPNTQSSEQLINASAGSGISQVALGDLNWTGDMLQQGSVKFVLNNTAGLIDKTYLEQVERLIRDLQSELYGDNNRLPYVLTLCLDLCERVGLKTKYETWLTKELTGYEDYEEFKKEFDTEDDFDNWMEIWASRRLIRPYIKFQYRSEHTGQLTIEKLPFSSFVVAYSVAEIARRIQLAKDRNVTEYSMLLRNQPDYFAQVQSFIEKVPLDLSITPDLEVFYSVADMERILDGVREKVLSLLSDVRMQQITG